MNDQFAGAERGGAAFSAHSAVAAGWNDDCYVSHRLEGNLRIVSDVSRAGAMGACRHAADCELQHDDLVQMMVAPWRPSPIAAFTFARSGAAQMSRCCRLLESYLKSRFELCSGEVVGLAGLVGAGRTEVLEALFGLDKSAHEKL